MDSRTSLADIERRMELRRQQIALLTGDDVPGATLQVTAAKPTPPPPLASNSVVLSKTLTLETAVEKSEIVSKGNDFAVVAARHEIDTTSPSFSQIKAKFERATALRRLSFPRASVDGQFSTFDNHNADDAEEHDSSLLTEAAATTVASKLTTPHAHSEKVSPAVMEAKNSVKSPSVSSPKHQLKQQPASAASKVASADNDNKASSADPKTSSSAGQVSAKRKLLEERLAKAKAENPSQPTQVEALRQQKVPVTAAPASTSVRLGECTNAIQERLKDMKESWKQKAIMAGVQEQRSHEMDVVRNRLQLQEDAEREAEERRQAFVDIHPTRPVHPVKPVPDMHIKTAPNKTHEGAAAATKSGTAEVKPPVTSHDTNLEQTFRITTSPAKAVGTTANTAHLFVSSPNKQGGAPSVPPPPPPTAANLSSNSPTSSPRGLYKRTLPEPEFHSSNDHAFNVDDDHNNSYSAAKYQHQSSPGAGGPKWRASKSAEKSFDDNESAAVKSSPYADVSRVVRGSLHNNALSPASLGNRAGAVAGFYDDEDDAMPSDTVHQQPAAPASTATETETDDYDDYAVATTTAEGEDDDDEYNNARSNAAADNFTRRARQTRLRTQTVINQVETAMSEALSGHSSPDEHAQQQHRDEGGRESSHTIKSPARAAGYNSETPSPVKTLRRVGDYRRQALLKTPNSPQQQSNTSGTDCESLSSFQYSNDPNERQKQITVRAVEKQIEHLLQEIRSQATIMSQTSMALNLCRETKAFQGSEERAEFEKHLLIATEKSKACKDEVARLRTALTTFNVRGTNPFVSDAKGDLTITDICLPTKAGFLEYIHSDAASQAVHYFLVLFKHRDLVLATQMLNSDQHLTPTGEFVFPNFIKFHDLRNDFDIRVEVYAVSSRREQLSHEEKYKIRVSLGGAGGSGHHHHSGGAWLSKLVKKMFSSSDGSSAARGGEAAANSSSTMKSGVRHNPAGPDAIRAPCFGKVGHCLLALANVNSTYFALHGVPQNSPLEGSIKMHITCTAEVTIEHEDFLTLFVDNEWQRRWVRLQGVALYMWKYPEDMLQDNLLMGHIDMRNCVSECCDVCKPEEGCRPHSFKIKFAAVTGGAGGANENARTQILAADSVAARVVWVEKLDRVLETRRLWGV